MKTSLTLTLAALAALTAGAAPHISFAKAKPAPAHKAAPARTPRLAPRLTATPAPALSVTAPAAAAASDTPAVPAADAPPVTSSAYVLAPFDTLDIAVQGHDEMHLPPQILPDGTFNYPIVGTIHASGMTVAQLKAYIIKKLADYYNQPEVTITVTSSHIQKITVSGIARTPGLYDYRPGMRIGEVVAQAGGSVNPQELTDLILVTKRDGVSTNIPIDIVGLLNGDIAQNLLLEPGDTLLLSPRDPAKAEVQIVGQVTKAGQYPVVKDGATVISLLTEAGGTTAYAALTQVQVIHDGVTTVYNLHPTLYNIDDPSGKVRVVAGDTINVPFNNNKIAIQGEVRSPSVYTIPDGEPLSIFSALSVAGGPTVEGDKKQVGIMRLGKDGQRRLIEINLENIYKARATKGVQVADLPLEDKDILIVPTRRHGHSAAEYLNAVPGYYYISRILSGHP